jgi:predicted alpha/beta-fold hydrolase
MRMARVITLVLMVSFLLTLAWLARLQHGGPARQDIELPGNEPATIYLPGPGYPFYTSFAPPVEQRPPCVVHGFTSDREFMSSLARRMAQNGYAVLAIDVHGHGSNRNPFSEGFESGPKSILYQDIKQAVDFLRDYPLVDGSRIVVMGIRWAVARRSISHRKAPN